MPHNLSPYEMTLSLNVLEHLGINLYSNIPSVLSEIVANAWDADADKVYIEFNKAKDLIEIKDNGIGMSHSEINERFLRVGYQRRADQGLLTSKRKRAPMGRKGIGKLSLFSIANKVDIYTVKNKEGSAFQMDLNDIRRTIQDKDQDIYHPLQLPTDSIDFEEGTKIILRDLRRRQTIGTAKSLRRRVARRFSIIGADKNFDVFINGEQVTPSDRDYYSKLQYMWTYGGSTVAIKLAYNLSRVPQNREAAVKDRGIRISGWLGTVNESHQLKDEESGDNLNRIAIFVRGKMAQEDILGDFSERGVYASYLIGELRVDDFDLDNQDDASTSNRQHLVEDDHRYLELREILAEELKYIQGQWRVFRAQDGATKALEIPELTAWVESLPSKHKNSAKSWLGRIYRLRTNSPDERKSLLRHAVFAFEFHKANQNLSALESIDDSSLDSVLEIFNDLDILENNLYGQIIRQRVRILKTLQEKINDNHHERIIQNFLYEHLWLLDPHWERVEASEHMEIRVDKIFKDLDAGLTAEERNSRLDIKYRKSAGTHIIIELKRPERVMSISKVIEQFEKYYTAFKKLLDAQKLNEPIEMVLIIGTEPREYRNPGGRERFKDMLNSYNARVVFYDELLNNAYRSYQDYLNKKNHINSLQPIIQAIDNYSE